MVEPRYHNAARVGQVLFIMLIAALANAQKPSAADLNKANNPLTPAITVNFQDQAQPLLYDLDQGSNAFLLRGVVPHKLGGMHQLFRYTLPVVTAPDGKGGTTTGLGDLNIFDVFPFLWKQKKDAMYLTVVPSKNDGVTIYKLTAKAVPVDGFWSISAYNAKGYFEKNQYDAYSLNNITAEKNADGSVTIQFGGCDGKIPNCLPTASGWNYWVRLYRPRAEILNGSWKFPDAQPVQ
jgi:Protein of unknown function (DUF1214)